MLQGLFRPLLASALLLAAFSASADPGRPKVHWHDEWPRIRTWEYFATAGALGGAFALRFAGPDPPDNWRGGILFDDAIMNRLAIEAPDNRALAKNLGDGLFYGSMTYRLVDSVFVPLLGYGDGDLALQMSMIDLEAFGTVGVVLWTTQLFVGRERRSSAHTTCADPVLLSNCSDERRRSFIAGHVSVVTAAAGVTCMHHGHIPLYGGDGDTIACGSMIGAAAMTGLARMWTEDHYPTDTLLGWGLGTFAGWFVPAALHYGFGGRRERAHGEVGGTARTARAMPPAVLIPWAANTGGGAVLTGLF